MNIGSIRKEVQIVEDKLRGCDQILIKHQDKRVNNIESCFKNKMDKSIALLMDECFEHYMWDDTKSLFLESLQDFLDSMDRDQKIVFVLHSESSSSTSENACYQKSSFLFTLIALLNVPSFRIAGIVCNRAYSFNVDIYDKSDLVYCVCEDSIYSGNQITKITESIVINHNVNMEDIIVVCPFISTRFERHSPRFKLYTKVVVKTFIEYILETDVADRALTKYKISRQDNDEISDLLRTISSCVKLYTDGKVSKDVGVSEKCQKVEEVFDFELNEYNQPMIYFSHRISDITSIPTHWLLGILGISCLYNDTPLHQFGDSELYMANILVRNEQGCVWNCARGSYKLRKESFKSLFNDIFVTKYYPFGGRPNVFTKLAKKFSKQS